VAAARAETLGAEAGDFATHVSITLIKEINYRRKTESLDSIQ
jgi:hypothetical protein